MSEEQTQEYKCINPGCDSKGVIAVGNHAEGFEPEQCEYCYCHMPNGKYQALEEQKEHASSCVACGAEKGITKAFQQLQAENAELKESNRSISNVAERYRNKIADLERLVGEKDKLLSYYNDYPCNCKESGIWDFMCNIHKALALNPAHITKLREAESKLLDSVWLCPECNGETGECCGGNGVLINNLETVEALTQLDKVKHG